jgi:hypothetical protein
LAKSQKFKIGGKQERKELRAIRKSQKCNERANEEGRKK